MSQSEHKPSTSDEPQSTPSRADVATDNPSSPSVTIQCPSCGERVDATLGLPSGDSEDAAADPTTSYSETEETDAGAVATDGGYTSGSDRTTADATLEGELCGKSVRCTDCGDEFELMFYY